MLESNILGHVHGTNSETETVCTVIGTRTDMTTEDQEFELFTVSDRRPTGLAPGTLSVVEARTEEVDVQIAEPGFSSYVRLSWKKTGGTFMNRLVSGVSSSTTLTIPGLDADSTYEIRASLMTRQSFDLYRAGDTGAPGTLISEGSPDSKWRRNLSYAGLGSGDSTEATTPMVAATAAVSIAPMTTTVAEGGSVEVTVTLSAALASDVTVPISHPGTGTATDGTDYSGVPADVTFVAGDVQEKFTLSAIDDGAADSSETVIIGFGTLPSGVTAGTPNTATITITDSGATVSITPATATVAEGATQVVTVTLSASFTTPKTIPLTITGTATNGTDYIRLADSVTVDANATTATFTLSATADLVADSGETVIIALGTPPTGVTNGASDTTTITITDSGAIVSITPATATVAEGASQVVTVTLSASFTTAKTIPLTITGTATTADDYTGVTDTVTVAANATTATFTLNATADRVADSGETVIITLGTPPSGVTNGASDTTTITITDSGATVSITPATATVAEGATQVITVTLSATFTTPKTIP